MTAAGARPVPAKWTRWYWPAAVLAAVLMLATVGGNTAIVFGLAVLGIPEAGMLATRQFQNTLSDWTWAVLRVRRRQPLSQWSALHFLALGGYIAVAVRADMAVWPDGYWPRAAALLLSVWLTWHLFRRWWR